MEPILEVCGLTKRYPGFELKDVSFRLEHGYVMGLIGANGAGKTTIIKLILNLVRKDSGEVRIFGQDHLQNEASLRERIGVVHEAPPFYDHLSAGAFARLVGRFYTRWNDQTFRRLSDEFELPLSKRIRTFSRGTKMKLALAMALSHEAELLLLDEPTGGLDPVFRRELLDRLRDLLQDERVSVLFSTHLTSDLERITDYVTLVRRGRLLFSESVDVIRDTWCIAKGGNDLLVPDVRRLFRACREEPFGFTALSDRPQEVRRALGPKVVLGKPALSDLVRYLEEENGHV